MIPIPRQAVIGVLLGAFVLPGSSQVLASPRDPIVVEASELTRRPDLVGEVVVVDDRVARIQFHPGRDFDQIFLKRAPDVPFELPERLRFKKSPQSPAVRLTGRLRSEAGRWWCEVSAVDLLPADLDRLNAALATMPRVDFDRRMAWVHWAEARADAFQDETLRARARAIETEILRDQADRPGRDPAEHWLALAERARSRRIPEPEPSALAHLGFQAALKGADTAAGLAPIIERLERFFPSAKSVPRETAPVDLSRWKRPYEQDPASAYRMAQAPDRQALDRKLWVDATAKWIERRAIEAPDDALTLAEDARARLPERPEIAESLYQRAVDAAVQAPDALALGEVQRLATIARERLTQPEKAEELLRGWLLAQRRGLGGTRDAEGRIALAGHFDQLVNDRESAIQLLREASALDPDSPQVAEAFLSRGFRKIEGQWAKAPAAARSRGGESDPGDSAQEIESIDPPEASRTNALLGASPEQVRARMGGRPSQRVVSATRGQILEQWIYRDARESRYVNFLQRTGDSRPRVVSYFSLPVGLGRSSRPSD